MSKHVYVVLTVGIIEHTVEMEIRGVYAHMHQAVSLSKYITETEHRLARVQKHEVMDTTYRPDQQPLPGTGWLPGGEGVQTDPTVKAGRA